MSSAASSRKVSYFVKVNSDYVVQMELYILTRAGEDKDWMQKQHCQEVEILLLDLIKSHVNDELRKKQKRKRRQNQEKARHQAEMFTQPQILTGETLRMAYSFKKRNLPHCHVLTAHKNTGYRCLRIFNEKLVVYVYHLKGYSSYRQSLNENHQTSRNNQITEMSSYFKADGKQIVDPHHHNVLKNIVHHNLELRRHLKLKKSSRSTMKKLDNVQTKEENDTLPDAGTELLAHDQENTKPQFVPHVSEHREVDMIHVSRGDESENTKPQFVPHLSAHGQVDMIHVSRGDESDCIVQPTGKSLPLQKKLITDNHTDEYDEVRCEKLQKPEAECTEVVQLNRESKLTSTGFDLVTESDKDKPVNSEQSVANSSSEVGDFVDDCQTKGIRKRSQPEPRKRRKKMKLLERFFDNFSTSPINGGVGDVCHFNGEAVDRKESTTDPQSGSVFPEDAVAVLSSADETNNRQGETSGTEADRMMRRNKYKFRRLKLKKTKLPSFDESICPGTSAVTSAHDNDALLTLCDVQKKANESCTVGVYHRSPSAEMSDVKTSTCVETASERDQSGTASSDDDLPVIMSSALGTCESGADDSAMKPGVQKRAGHDLSQPVFIDDSDDDRVTEEIQQIRHISSLSDDHLNYLVRANKGYLKDIFQSKMSSRRHEDYKLGIKQRANLSWQIPLGLFTDPQVDLILHILQTIFCSKHKKHLDYVLKVLFPEILIKIYMDVFHVDHSTAEDRMSNAVYEMDSQLELNLSDTIFSSNF